MHQATYNIAELCAQKGLRNVVLCPGSRCAPLTLAFTRHSTFTVKTFSDERSAGFIALGLAEQTKIATVLICTSGSAVYNFAPAVAEAFFNNIPLLIITADRPVEWIGQGDGQAIYQHDIFKNHVRKSFQLPQSYEHGDDIWSINRQVNEAINLAKSESGPVHINVPFREPFYPTKNESIHFDSDVRVMNEELPSIELSHDRINFLQKEFSTYSRILIIAGQTHLEQSDIECLQALTKTHGIPIVGDITSNLHAVENAVLHADVFLGNCHDEVKKSLQPDLLITFGKSVLSKSLKIFIRKFFPTAHWHIQPSGNVADTFQYLSTIIRTLPLSFFNSLLAKDQTESFESQKQHNYFKLWEIEERRVVRSLNSFFPQSEVCEFEIVKEIIDSLPVECNLHLASSMSVRYANFIGLTSNHDNCKVYSNRGTSGIDGCTSTSVGHSFANSKPNILITGDIAFFYDRNAFWHNYPIPNLRVVLLNNHGGIIFKMIDGPADLSESDEFFVTRQKLTGKKLCEEFGFDYLKIDNKRKVKNLIKDFLEQGDTPKVLEVDSSLELNKYIYQNFKNHIKKSYEL